MAYKSTTDYKGDRRAFLKGTAVAVASNLLSPLELVAQTSKQRSPQDEIVDHIHKALTATRYGISPRGYAETSKNHYEPAVAIARKEAQGKNWEKGWIYQALEIIALMHEARMHKELVSTNIIDPNGHKIRISWLPDIYIPNSISSSYRVNNLLKALQNYERVGAIHEAANKQGKNFPQSVYSQRLAMNGLIATLETVYDAMLNTLSKLDAETNGKHSTIIAQRKRIIGEKLNNIQKPSTRKVKI